MADFSLSGGVRVLGYISPFDTNDTYAVIDPLYGIDGLRNVTDLTELNAIPEERRRAGMVVGVSGGSAYYKLRNVVWSGITDDWEPFITGGSGSGETYTNLNPTPTTIGGIPAGSSFLSQTMTQMWDALLYPYQSPSLTTTKKTIVNIGETLIYSAASSDYSSLHVDYNVTNTSGVRGGNFTSVWSGSTTQYLDTKTNDIGNTSNFTLFTEIVNSDVLFKASASTNSWTVNTIIRTI